MLMSQNELDNYDAWLKWYISFLERQTEEAENTFQALDLISEDERKNFIDSLKFRLQYVNGIPRKQYEEARQWLLGIAVKEERPLWRKKLAYLHALLQQQKVNNVRN